MTQTGLDTAPKKPMGLAGECHYTCSELSLLWHMSESTIFKLFVDEPDVVKLGIRSQRKRTKVSIRIPQSVAERVHKRMRAS